MKNLIIVLVSLLASSEALSTPLGYSFTFHLDGVGELGVFGLTPADEAFSGAIGFYSPLAANLDSTSVGVRSFSVTVGNTTWDYQNLLGPIAYVSTDQSGLLTKINGLTADSPSDMFAIIDAGWYAMDKLSGDGSCVFWPTTSGYCAYGWEGIQDIVSLGAVPEPSSHALLLIGLGAALIGRRNKKLQAKPLAWLSVHETTAPQKAQQ